MFKIFDALYFQFFHESVNINMYEVVSLNRVN
jgi:hypothetical protein